MSKGRETQRVYVNPSMRFVVGLDVALDVSGGPLGCGSVPGLVLAYPTFWNLRGRH